MSARGRALALSALLLALWPSGRSQADAVAEEKLSLAPGSLVRVAAPTVSSGRLTGTLVAATEREIVLEVSPSERKTIPRSAVKRFEWSRGRRGHPVAGLIVGALVGGAALGVLSGLVCDADNCEGSAAKGFLLGAGLGALPGAGIGALIKTRDWVEAPLASVQVFVVPVRGNGLAMGVTLRF